jgi:hypothetical protein
MHAHGTRLVSNFIHQRMPLTRNGRTDRREASLKAIRPFSGSMDGTGKEVFEEMNLLLVYPY